MKRIYLLIILAIPLLYFSSCRKDLDNIAKPQWNPQLSFPWIKTSMTLADILPEDSSLSIGEDHLLKIIYRNDSFYSFQATNFLQIPEQQAEAELIRIDKLAIPDLNSEQNIILWEFIDYIDQEARDSLIANNGANAMFPAGTLIAPYSSDFSVFENFDEASLAEGVLELKVSNELPVPVTDVEVELNDADEGKLIATFIFEEIPAGATVSEQLNLQDMEISNHLKFSLLSMYTPGSQEPVFVDLNDGIYFNLTAGQLIMYSGSGLIEEQYIATQHRKIDLALDDSAAWLERITFKTATLSYAFESFLPVDLLLEVRLPGGVKNNEIPSNSVMIPAGEKIEQNWNLEGLVLNLNDQEINSIDVEYDLHVFGSDGIITVDTNSFVMGLIHLEDLVISDAIGYFGKSIFDIEAVEFPFSPGIMGNFIQGLVLDDPNIELNYTSSTGVPLDISFRLKGVSADGATHILEPGNMMINAAAFPGDEVSGNFVINKQNSSVVDFLSAVPEIYTISGTAVTNSVGMQQNFILKESTACLGVEMDLPLVLQSGNFVFSDTVNIYYTSDQLDKLETAVFNIDALNGFPFNLSMQIIPLDRETLQPADTIQLAKLNAASTNSEGRVSTPFHTSMSIDLDSESLFHLKQANKMIIKASMNTEGNPGIAALCTDYALDVKIGLQANVNY